MAAAGRTVDHASRVTPRRWPTLGVLAVSASKLADALTTAVGLTYFPLIELNPVVRSLMAHVGIVPGVLLGGVLVVAFITLVTECGVYTCRRLSADPRWSVRVRYAGYGPPTLLFTAVSVSNAALILSVS